MRKYKFLFIGLIVLIFSLAVVSSLAAETDLMGKVVKLEDSSTLYYISTDGERYVFPNAKTYYSWFSDFSDVMVVTEAELGSYPLVGNIRYRPGVLLVKIQTDPRVYAVSRSGILRWIENESVAKKLYGSFWNELVDDISPAFFVNYTVGESIDEEGDFDPDDESDGNETIDENRGKKISSQAQQRVADTKRCKKRGPVRICRVGEEENVDVDEQDVDDLPGDTVRICHIPSGNPDNAHTIIVGKPAIKAHLAHGDILGACEGDEEADTTPPVISGIGVTASTTSAVVIWVTDELSDSEVEYATESLTTASSTNIVSGASLVTDHSLDLTGLTASTTYYYLIESVDASGNVATSSQRIFATTP